MLDLDYGARAEPHELWRWVFQSDTYRESLLYAHPVERALHVGNRPGQIDSILIHHPPADAVDDPADGQAPIEHRIHGYTVAGMHRGKVHLAKIGRGEPFFGIDESEERLPRDNEFPAGH